MNRGLIETGLADVRIGQGTDKSGCLAHPMARAPQSIQVPVCSAQLSYSKFIPAPHRLQDHSSYLNARPCAEKSIVEFKPASRLRRRQLGEKHGHHQPLDRLVIKFYRGPKSRAREK